MEFLQDEIDGKRGNRMIYYAITKGSEIEAAQGRFESALRKNAMKYPDCKLGYPGGHESTDLFWHSDRKFWFGHKEVSTRHWNVFGTEDPDATSSHNILCEINIPYEGRSKSVQGIFLRDKREDGNVYVAHQGRLTITGAEVKAQRFLDWVRSRDSDHQDIIDVIWDEGHPEQTEAILVCGLDDPKLVGKVRDFVIKAWNFKGAMKNSVIFKRHG
jgi:hypothetical protein